DIEGKALGSFFMGLSRAERNWAHLLALADFGARLAGIAVAYARATLEMQRARVVLEQELADTRRLQQISMRLLASGHDDSLYSESADTAADIMEADFASMQILHADRGERGEMHLVAHKGLSPEDEASRARVQVQHQS